MNKLDILKEIITEAISSFDRLSVFVHLEIDGNFYPDISIYERGTYRELFIVRWEDSFIHIMYKFPYRHQVPPALEEHKFDSRDPELVKNIEEWFNEFIITTLRI
jgi:hypothetical protein